MQEFWLSLGCHTHPKACFLGLAAGSRYRVESSTREDGSVSVQWADKSCREKRFAEVVVRTPLGRKLTSRRADDAIQSEDLLHRTFHYLIPASLRDQVSVGHLVWVPFGTRHLQGVVVGLSDVSPVRETKEIEQLLFPYPLLSPERIQLAYWMSERYLAPLHQTIWVMLPSGLGQEMETYVEIAETAHLRGDCAPEQRRVLEFLATQGQVTTRQLARGVGIANWRAVLADLVRRGMARRWQEIKPPRVRRKVEAFVRLTQHIDDGLLRALSRAPRQRAVVEYLAEQPAGSWTPMRLLSEKVLATSAVVNVLLKKGFIEKNEREIWRDPLAGREFVATEAPRLMPDQNLVWERIRRGLDDGGGVYLLHGVTGSGKTEIYLRALGHVLQRGQGGIILVPEIALTPQTIRRFAARYRNHLAVQHSRLSPGERYDQWERVRQALADVVIGPRSALFAPVNNLGLIVLDEEHESSYKQENVPRYHARDVAIKLGELTGATVVLGSATPAIESYYRAQRGEYSLQRLPRRIMGHRKRVEEQVARYGIGRKRTRVKGVGVGYEDAVYMELPTVQIVDLRQELRAGNYSIFSRALQRAMRNALEAKQQIILFLNRRGSATFVMCRDCGHVIKCKRCEVPMTYHGAREQLICHHCNRRAPVPGTCPECASKRVKFFGVGTQRVEKAVGDLFPDARILRWDRDVTGHKAAHEDLLQAFIHHEADILIGTQMIAKGLDLPLVTLVGVITADTALNLPDFRAGERTFQLLTQVAGRAGRSFLGGKVIIQSYTPQHYAIQAASQHDYEVFYRREIAFRREQWYPPLSQLVKLVYLDSNRVKCQAETLRVHRVLSNRIERLGMPEVELIGPAPCFFGRTRGKYRWQIIVRGTEPGRVVSGLALMRGWRVDVDPVSVL